MVKYSPEIILINCSGIEYSQFTLQNRTKKLKEIFGNVVRTDVLSAVGGPFEVLLVDVSIAVSYCAHEYMVRDTKEFNEGYCLWSDLLQQNIDGLLNEPIITSF